MRKSSLNKYVCPFDSSKLELNEFDCIEHNVISGLLVSPNGFSYSISNGIPDLTYPKQLSQIDQQARDTYEKLADEYHIYTKILSLTYKSSEDDVRNNIIDKLSLKADSKVLEIGCGCGDGSKYIADRLSEDGELFLQELSPAFLDKAVNKLKNHRVPIEFSVANACYLSFADDYFDAAHHFGGLNTFSDIRRCLSEMARVVRPGGKVVIGDEGMAPWLRDTEFAKIMMNSNPLLKFSPPLKSLPAIAMDVSVEWIMLGAYYVIEFTVAENEPEGDYHVQIPSMRGGSHWTRYHGQLEGVSDETKIMAINAQKESGKSMAEWLDDVVRRAAEKELS